MKVIKIIGAVIILLVVALLIAIYTLPSSAHMERSIVIEASPDQVYTELMSFRNFNAWSPWALKDTAAIYTYEGPKMGVGTRIKWKSENQDVGSGYMEITDAVKGRRVTTRMNFDGYPGEPTGTFLIEPMDEHTRLIWTYDEKNISGLNKIFMLGIDGFLGEDYETGLAGIKKRIESTPDFDHELSLENVKSFTYIGIKDSALNDPSLVSSKMAQNYGALVSFLGNKGVEMTGYPVAMYSSYDDQELEFTCGIPVAQGVELENQEMVKATSPDGLVIKAKYVGGYGGILKAYDDIERFAAYYNYKPIGKAWEEYVTDPEMEPDTSQWITNIYYPVE